MSYISEAIKPVFQPNQGRVNRANEYLNTYSNDTPTLLAKLGELCRCTFLDNAKLYYRTPTAAESKEISDAYVTEGVSIPDNMAVETLVGSTSIPIDSVKTFYSCTSLDDTSPTVIATGSDTLSGRELARQACNTWAYSKAFNTVNSKITTDTNGDNVYVSISSTGGCFNAAGDLRTIPALASSDSLDIVLPPLAPLCSGSLCSTEVVIPSLEVSCSGSTCSTVSTYIAFGYQAITIPSLEVTCVDSVCTTPTITITVPPLNFNIYVPSLTVDFISPTAGSLSALCNYELDN
jgi:hypothetical protein